MNEVIKINDNTWTIVDKSVRCYILIGEKNALLIDTGMNISNIKDIVRKVTDLPIILINTHADPDHISANAEFDEFYMNPAEAGNYYKDHNGSGRMLPIENGDRLDIGNRPLEIISLPGHTPGSIGILDINNRMFFSGDPIQDGRIFMFGARREMHAYILSLKKVIAMQDRFDDIYPSHGSFPIKADFIPKLIQAAETILEGNMEGKQVELFGSYPYYYDFGFASFLYDN